MDLETKERTALLSELKEKLSVDCLDLTDGIESAAEDIATQDEAMMERYLSEGSCRPVSAPAGAAGSYLYIRRPG